MQLELQNKQYTVRHKANWLLKLNIWNQRTVTEMVNQAEVQCNVFIQHVCLVIYTHFTTDSTLFMQSDWF